jgi:hypothetical protein
MINKMSFSFSKITLLRFSLIIVAIYLFSFFLISWTTENPITEDNFFTYKQGYGFVIGTVLYAFNLFSGLLIMMFIPGILAVPLFYKKKLDFSGFLVCGALLNFILLIIGGNLYKLLMGGELNRSNFLLIILILTITISLFLKTENSQLTNPLVFDFDYIKVATFCVIVFSFLYILKQNFIGTQFNINTDNLLAIPLGQQDDISELVGITKSLRTHLYPYWDLEYSNKMGFHVIDPPLAYFYFLHSTLLFGNTKAAFASIFLLAFVFILIISFLISRERIPGKNIFYIALLPICIYFLRFLLASERVFLVSSFNLFTTSMLGIYLYYLVSRKFNFALVFGIVSFLMFYESSFFIFLSLFFSFFMFAEDRQRIKTLFKHFLFAVAMYFLVIFLIGYLNGDLMTYWRSIVIEKLMRFDYFDVLKRFFPDQYGLWPAFEVGKNTIFIKWFFSATAFFGITLFLPKKDTIATLFSWLGVIYLFFILLSTYKNEHYVIIPAVLTSFVAPRYLYYLDLSLAKKRV